MHAPSLPNGSCHPCLQVHYSMAEIPGSLFVPIEDQSHSPFATDGESGHPLGLRSASGQWFPASPEVQPFGAPATKGCIRIRLHLSALGGKGSNARDPRGEIAIAAGSGCRIGLLGHCGKPCPNWVGGFYGSESRFGVEVWLRGGASPVRRRGMRRLFAKEIPRLVEVSSCQAKRPC